MMIKETKIFNVIISGAISRNLSCQTEKRSHNLFLSVYFMATREKGETLTEGSIVYGW